MDQKFLQIVNKIMTEDADLLRRLADGQEWLYLVYSQGFEEIEFYGIYIQEKEAKYVQNKLIESEVWGDWAVKRIQLGRGI